MKTSRIIIMLAIALSLTFATYAKDTQSCTKADKAACCKSEKCCTKDAGCAEGAECCSKADCCNHSATAATCEKSCCKKSCEHKTDKS
jgi:hypothetical protein